MHGGRRADSTLHWSHLLVVLRLADSCEELATFKEQIDLGLERNLAVFKRNFVNLL